MTTKNILLELVDAAIKLLNWMLQGDNWSLYDAHQQNPKKFHTDMY